MRAQNATAAQRLRQPCRGFLACALIAIGVAMAGTASALAQATAPSRNRDDFDHQVHSQKNQLSGQADIACAVCHTLRDGLIRSRPNHASCFGSCHATAPTRANAATRFAAEPRLCGACHPAPSPGTGRHNYRATFAPTAADRDFGLALSHQAHSSTTCQTCHRTTGASAAAIATTKPHARCRQCHGASTVERRFAITECSRCHTVAFGPASTPTIAHGVLAVTNAFVHQQAAHRKAPCATCHRTVAASTADVLDPPTMVSCGTSNCHDGITAFATTQACSRCHQAAPAQTFTIARPTKRYSHGGHAEFDRRAGISPAPCTSCHRNGNNEPTPPPHDACTACHASDFAASQPIICGACHQSTEPWRALAADQRPLPTSEFGARLDHRSHATACTTCHTLTTATTELRPPRGHSSCSTCHRDQATPRLTQCSGCHQPNLAIERTQQRLAAAWSTRRQFDHGAHSRAARPGECSDCHIATPTTAEIMAYPTPPKAACARCHDGQRAFSVTSTACRRCHGNGPAT
ncbi:MAG: hypothetical protein KBG15_01160 [Kofleriaceae bacterium]|nr:hypothetical protein [Kofleriaceae bacterium]